MAVCAKTPIFYNPSLATNLLLPAKTLSFSLSPQTPHTPRRPSATLDSHPTTLNPPNPNPQISRLCLHGHLQSAMMLLLSPSPHPILEHTYVALLSLCQRKRSPADGRRVFHHILASSPSPTHFTKHLGNALLAMFVQFENLDDAWLVFAKMEDRDVFSWNVMLGGYAKLGFFDEALDLYRRMLWAGIKPDIYTFPCVLRTCGGVPDLVVGREVHVHVLRHWFESEVDVVNALITMYAKARDMSSARKLFDHMPLRDRISWNAMISGYFENGECLEGLKLFSEMRDLSVEPNLMTITSVVSAAELLGAERLGRELQGYAFATGFCMDVAVCNALIQMYVTLLNVEAAEKVFSRMQFRDVVSWTAMILGYVKNGLPLRAVECYDLMESEGVEMDEVAVASALSAYTCLGLLERGIKLHEFANMSGLISYTMVRNMLIDLYMKCGSVDKALQVFRGISEKNVISWTSMILGFRINKQSFEALNFFRKMQFHLKPSCVTYVAALSACSAMGAFMCGKEIHAHVLRNGFGSDDFIPNALMDMYAKCGRMEYALIQFNIHENKDISSWNIMLTGYSRQECGDLAKELFDRMKEMGIRPNEITFTALLSAFSRSGMVSEGWDYFNSMSPQYSVAPTLKHYTCMVDLLGRNGHLDKALEFIEKMPIEVDVSIWGAFLNACRIHRQTDLGELAAQFIFDKLDFSDGVGYHVLLCNFYGDNERWDQVAKVRRLMIERGLTADPGCSWVEAKGNVHAFLTGDKSHPQMKEICSVLNGLYERMRLAGFDVPEVGNLDDIEASKAEIFCGHSERSAVAFGLINSIPGSPVRVTKNLFMCSSCHHIVKLISKVVRREVTVRDTEKFHHFKDGFCSCRDEGYWGRPTKWHHLKTTPSL